MSILASDSRSSLMAVAPHANASRAPSPALPAGLTAVAVQPPRALERSLFRDALVRERQRADRFDDPFVLLLVSVPQPGALEFPLAQVVDAVTTVLRPTDVFGWFEQDSVLGVIRPQAELDLVGETALDLEAAVRQAVALRTSTDRMASCSVRVHCHPSPDDSVAAPIREASRPQAADVPSLLRRVVKRALDIVGSATLLVASLPVFLVVAALVKLTSKGPILFRQPRVGHGARPFMMLKFRTMEAGAAATVHQQYVAQFIRGGAVAQGAGDGVYKLQNDRRVTPLGRLLRRSSLDELPQFWNVFTGEMSLVGPRPPLPYEVGCYQRWHRRRLLEAKPGITGLWQVTGRSRTTFDEMVRLDLRYARNPSIWVDMKILAATPRAVISGNGAH